MIEFVEWLISHHLRAQHPDHLTKLFYEAGLASSPDRALKVRLYHWDLARS